MSVKLQKERIKLSEVVCSHYCQTTVENDVIVPDINPDILKIMQVSNSVAITQKNIQPGKVYIQGIIHANILYVPDGEDLGTVKAINTDLDFNHTIDLKDAKPEMDLWVEAECDPAEYTPVNSRKLNLRTKIGLDVRLSQSSDVDLATGIDGDEPIQLKESCLKIYNLCIDTERDIIIRERPEVPAGKPAIFEILKISAKPSSVELRLLNDKAVAKGEVKICTLYCGEGEQRCIEYMEHTVPFSEILEIDGLTEAMNGEVDYSVKNIYYEVCPDPDGDKRIINCEITLSAGVRAFETIECNTIEDAYGIQHNIELEKTLYRIEQLVECTSAQCTAKEPINIPDYLPEIHQLCDCNAVPTIENISIENGCVTVNGYSNCNILYLANDENTPLSGFNHILTFNHRFEIPGATEGCLCDATAEIEHTSCVINGGRSLELRTVIAINLKVISPQNVEVIASINCDDNVALPKPPAMIVYFVQKGDTLWKIAKRYHSSVEAIKSANKLDSDEIRPGQILFIYR